MLTADILRIQSLKDAVAEQKVYPHGLKTFLTEELLNKSIYFRSTAKIPAVRIVLERHGVREFPPGQGRFVQDGTQLHLPTFKADLEVAKRFMDLSDEAARSSEAFKDALSFSLNSIKLI